MGSPQMQVVLGRCVDRIYATTCWEEAQQTRQRSKQVGAERWTSLEHVNLVKIKVFPPAVLAVDAREVPSRRRPVSCRCGRCMAGTCSVSAWVMRDTVPNARGGGNSGLGGRGWDSTVVTRPRLIVTFFRVYRSRRCGYFAGLGCNVAHASGRGGGYRFSCFLLFEREGLSSTVSDHACLSTSVRVAVVTELSEVRVHKQPLALMKECIQCLSECASSWEAVTPIFS